MQKENLSALIDGEYVDDKLVDDLINNRSAQADWFRYHVIRDVLRNDNSVVLPFTFADQVFAAIENEDINVAKAPEHVESIMVSQPNPDSVIPSVWGKMNGWFSQIGQVGIAAAVSLAVIIGFQQYNSSVEPAKKELSTFSAFRISEPISQVSYGAAAQQENNSNAIAYDQRKRMIILQEYELQRRLYKSQGLLQQSVEQSVRERNSQ